MQILWAPWRVAFITNAKEEGCIFCNKSSKKNDDENLIFERRRYVFGMLNKFPYNSGHLLIAPYRHLSKIEDLSLDELTEMFALLRDLIKVMKKQMRAEGFNIGLNIGRSAGAGFEHIHLHLVPRWSGDTNFMPVLSDIKVLPEHLEETLKKIKEGLKED